MRAQKSAKLPASLFAFKDQSQSLRGVRPLSGGFLLCAPPNPCLRTSVFVCTWQADPRSGRSAGTQSSACSVFAFGAEPQQEWSKDTLGTLLGMHPEHPELSVGSHRAGSTRRAPGFSDTVGTE